MYVDGHSYYKDLPLKAKRDLTMYIKWQRQLSVYFEGEPGSLPLRRSIRCNDSNKYGHDGRSNGDQDQDGNITSDSTTNKNDDKQSNSQSIS